MIFPFSTPPAGVVDVGASHSLGGLYPSPYLCSVAKVHRHEKAVGVNHHVLIVQVI